MSEAPWRWQERHFQALQEYHGSDFRSKIQNVWSGDVGGIRNDVVDLPFVGYDSLLEDEDRLRRPSPAGLVLVSQCT